MKFLRVSLVLLMLGVTGSGTVHTNSKFGGGPAPNPTCGPDGCGNPPSGN